MSIKAVLFDLDGTLLPLDQDLFMKTYFVDLTHKLVSCGLDKDKFSAALISGIKAMMINDGKKTNETVFWEVFTGFFGAEYVERNMRHFEAFYEEDFDKVKRVCGFDKEAAETVRSLKKRGFLTALATNPAFPSIATEKRMAWAGLQPSDFDLYTTYENSGYCKPNPDYYTDVASRLGVEPCECLMIGNDTLDDMIAEKLGMKVFLLTDCLINRENKDISKYPRGGYAELKTFLEGIC